MTTELFARSRTSVRRPVTIRAVQAALRPDEVLFELARGEPASFGIIVIRASGSSLGESPASSRNPRRLVNAFRIDSGHAADGRRTCTASPQGLARASRDLKPLPLELCA